MAHDPGGKVRLKLQPDVTGMARFSPCGKYRYTLERCWAGVHAPFVPFMLSIGLNPSTAEVAVDDPTIRRDIALTRRLGFLRMIKVNLFAFRTTDPKNLAAPELAFFSENMTTVMLHAIRARMVIVCWGKVPRELKGCADGVEAGLRSAGVQMWCLGTNNDGSPKHPLYVRGDTQLERYKPGPIF